MKRIKESGATFRKKKKAREEVQKKNEGALLKYVFPKETTSNNLEKNISEEPDVEESSLNDSAQTILGRHECKESTSNDSGENILEEAVKLSSSSIYSSASGEERTEQSIDVSNLKDVGQWPSSIDNNTRVLLVLQGSSAVQHLDSDFCEVMRPGASVKGQNRKLTSDWFYQTLPNGEKMLRSWMVYSPSKKSVYCFCCKLFSHESFSKFDSDDGFNLWWKLNPKISDHESSPKHIENFMKWKELEINLGHGATIDKREQNILENETKTWREILFRLLDIIRFLAKQNLAFRGHREEIRSNTESTENKGNFLELVDLLAKYDPVLREHVLRIKIGKKYSTSYLSPTIQNEFIEILGNKVRKTIIEEIKKAKYFCIIFDSTPDISHKNQISQIIRYVVIDENEVNVKESFIDFIQTKGKSAEELSSAILKKLENDGLDIHNCRGQVYDNAAVMAGKHSGVQKRIKEISKTAEFVACADHSLNLACVHAASVAVNSVTFFGIIERLFTFFHHQLIVGTL